MNEKGIGVLVVCSLGHCYNVAAKEKLTLAALKNIVMTRTRKVVGHLYSSNQNLVMIISSGCQNLNFGEVNYLQWRKQCHRNQLNIINWVMKLNLKSRCAKKYFLIFYKYIFFLPLFYWACRKNPCPIKDTPLLKLSFNSGFLGIALVLMMGATHAQSLVTQVSHEIVITHKCFSFAIHSCFFITLKQEAPRWSWFCHYLLIDHSTAQMSHK